MPPPLPIDVARDSARAWPRAVVIAWRIAQAVTIVAILICAGRKGVELRREAWEFTKPIRFQSDIQRNLLWGMEAANDSYLNPYERQQDQDPDANVWLDYAPLRLALMRYWGQWVQTNYPDVQTAYAEAVPRRWGDYSQALRARERAIQSVWRPTWEFHRPIVYTNMALEGLSAVALFLLVRLWVIRHHAPGSDHDPFRYLTPGFWIHLGQPRLPTPVPYDPLLGCWRGLAAVLLAWFSPAILMSAYGWPTYDSWVIPAYLWAVLMASTGRWFLAGMAVGIGAMAKGQILAVSPVFVLWALLQFHPRQTARWVWEVIVSTARLNAPLPKVADWSLVIGRPGAALAWAAGLATAIALIARPWLFSYAPEGNLDVPRVTDAAALRWAFGAAGAAMILAVLPWILRRVPWRQVAWASGAIVTVGAAVVVLAPLWNGEAHRGPAMTLGVLGVLAIVLANWVLPGRGRLYTVPAAWAMSALLCVIIFNGSVSWAKCGWGFGMKHWPEMSKVNACNIPGTVDWLMSGGIDRRGRVRRVQITDEVFTLPRHALVVWPDEATEVTWKGLMNGLFVGALVLSGVAMARSARRRSAWFLAAQAAPWLVFFLFPVQIHERYLLFGTGVAFAAVGASFGMGLLGYLLSIITALMTAATAMWLSTFNGGEGYAAMGREIHPDFGTKVYRLAYGAYPHTAWAVLAITGVFLWGGLRAARREERAKLPGS